MIDYLVRRLLYSIPILLGVMLITFILFFVVQSRDSMARKSLGPKASQQAVDNWLHNRGYDKPLLINTRPDAALLDSLFFNHLKSLLFFDFGISDHNGERIGGMLRQGAIPSLMITLPSLVLGMVISLSISLFLVMVRDSALDRFCIFLTVTMMSVSILTYVIFIQGIAAMKFSWFPAFGYHGTGWESIRFLALPVLIAVISSLGDEIRLYRAIFIEEIFQDYVRTARAKGVSAMGVLFVHVFKNGMISLITLVVASLPFLIMGSLILENFFGIPGLGNLTFKAISTADFAVIRASVYLGSLLYMGGLILTDIGYAWADPRIRLK